MSNRVVTVNTAYSETPEAESVWMTESEDLCAQQYRVISVADNNDNRWTINAASHDPDKYVRIDSGAVIDIRPVSVRQPGWLSAPVNIVIRTSDSVQQGITLQTLLVSWDKPPHAIAYEAQWCRNEDVTFRSRFPGKRCLPGFVILVLIKEW